MSSLQLKKADEQQRRIDGLDAMKSALMGTTATAAAAVAGKNMPKKKEAPKPTSNKAKKAIVASEVEHMKLVLEHPAYQQDPLATLREHLQNSLANDRKQQEIASKERLQHENKEREEQKKSKKRGGKKKYKPRRIG